MQKDRTTKRKRERTNESRGTENASSELFLRQCSDPRYERRFEAKAPIAYVLSVLGMSVGAVAFGAGTYAAWFAGEAFSQAKNAPYFLAAGSAVLLVVALF